MMHIPIMKCAFHSLLLVGVLLSGLPLASADEDHALARKLRDAGAILPLEDIVRHARAAKAGELLETELEEKQGRYIYEVEILDKSGQVWELKLDAANGHLISMERDD
jgi:uncharacterized membrane protein YkoI